MYIFKSSVDQTSSSTSHRRTNKTPCDLYHLPQTSSELFFGAQRAERHQVIVFDVAVLILFQQHINIALGQLLQLKHHRVVIS